MATYISDIYDLDTMCKSIANELDLPDGFYIMERGSGNAANTAYFRIKGNTSKLATIQDQTLPQWPSVRHRTDQHS